MSWTFGLLLVLGSSQIAAAQKCYGLALEGGGSRGAYEAGALWALTNNLPVNETMWNIVTGISTGALNAGGFSQFPYGQEKAGAQFLVDVWQNITGDSDIYVDWPIGKFQGLFFESGIYNNGPLKKLVKSLFSTGAQRNFTVGTTNLNTGDINRFDETFADIVSTVIASSSAPYVFPTHDINGVTYSDGGDIVNLDIFSAIERCEQVVSSDRDIVMDMIFLEPGYLSEVNLTEKWTVSDVNSRVSEIRSYYHKAWYILAAQVAHPDVEYRYIIQPVNNLPGGLIPLNFSSSNIEDMISLGKSDAVKAINGESAYRAEHYRDALTSRMFISE